MRRGGIAPTVNMNAVIVDDEKPARDELAYLLKGFPEVTVVGQGKNGLEAVSLIKEHNPDLVFLDVQMPGLDGFGVIKRLKDRKGKMPHIVFATAYDQYAVQAFEVNAVDYILKPFDKQRLAKAIQRARKSLGAEAFPAERLETLVSQLGQQRQGQPAKVKLLLKIAGTAAARGRRRRGLRLDRGRHHHRFRRGNSKAPRTTARSRN